MDSTNLLIIDGIEYISQVKKKKEKRKHPPRLCEK